MDTISVLQKYKNDYNSTILHREFINNLRNKYKDNYCKEICKWEQLYVSPQSRR